MEQLVGEFVKVGIVGVIAAGAIVQYLKVRREKDEAANAHHKEIRELYDKHAAEVRALSEEHRQELQVMADRHMEKADKANEKGIELSARVTNVLEAIARQGERRPPRGGGI